MAKCIFCLVPKTRFFFNVIQWMVTFQGWLQMVSAFTNLAKQLSFQPILTRLKSDWPVNTPNSLLGSTSPTPKGVEEQWQLDQEKAKTLILRPFWMITTELPASTEVHHPIGYSTSNFRKFHLRIHSMLHLSLDPGLSLLRGSEATQWPHSRLTSTRFIISHQNREKAWLSLMSLITTGIDPTIEESTLRRKRCMTRCMAVINLRIDLAPLRRREVHSWHHLTRALLISKLN